MKGQIPREADELFRRHFERYAQAAGRDSLLAGAETESDAIEFSRFVETRFRGLVDGFVVSFHDSLGAIGEPFRIAASNGVASRRGDR